MEPALDVINRALHGDEGARSFLERTSSIYVLDVTDASNPKTYGCWNYIHQAMNEVERYESKYVQSRQGQSLLNGAGLEGHVRLLASMALRVARRCPPSDKALITTCLANSEQFSGSPEQSQWLIDLNLELREIVMGRIAAMAFDFSFHRKVGPNGHSAFADPVVMDTFCAILSANAVSSGPNAIRHFATEWIIPSSKNLPAFAVASVVLHLASEGIRKAAPAGTKDILQQLSLPVVSVVLVPLLSDAVTEDSTTISQSVSPHEASSQISTMCIRAMKAWCDSTDLSMPQIKHICSKVDINFVGVISDAMYSDSANVVDALAELIEAIVFHAGDKPVTDDRMNQVRYIIQVDEEAFQQRFSADQLKTIESREMASIVEELVSAVGLQRFRFVERQDAGDHDVCRNLAHIAASVCLTRLSCCTSERPDPGMLNLLQKAAGHPLVNTAGIAIDALAKTAARGQISAHVLLPILQRRAIIPHRFNSSGILSLAAYDVCGVCFHEFQNFRDSVLAGALVVCWKADGQYYMDSCTSAIEEFCTERPSTELSLQLEAALYCIEAVVLEAVDSHNTFPHYGQMRRCTVALVSKPPSLMSNPVTLTRMCRLIRKFSSWYADEGGLDAATGLIVATYLQAVSSNPEQGPMQDVVRESHASPAEEALFTLKELLSSSPNHYATDLNVRNLLDAWETIYSSGRSAISTEACIALCIGINNVLATLPSDQRLVAFQAMAKSSIDSLEQSVKIGKESSDASSFKSVSSRLSNDIRVLAALPRAFADAGSSLSKTMSRTSMESGCDTSPDNHAPIPISIMPVVQQGVSSVSFIASTWIGDENVSKALGSLLSDLLPSTLTDENGRRLLKELFSIANAMVKSPVSKPHFDPLFDFLGRFVHTFGEGVEQVSLATLRGSMVSEQELEVGSNLEDLIVALVAASRDRLGSVWSRPKEQRQGQPAFESRPSPVRRQTSVPNELLSGMFALLKNCMDSCPVFVLHLPAGPGVDREDDMLLQRALDSAVASLNDVDPVLAENAMRFLRAAANSVSSPQKKLQSFLSETFSRVSADMTSRLLLGCCGKFKHSSISDAASLLSILLTWRTTAEVEANVLAALRQDYFLLGEPARRLAMSVLGRAAQKQLSSDALTAFLEDVWQLHQVEGAEALPNSDLVLRFHKKYHE